MAEESVRRMPKRVVEVALPAPYDVFHVRLWVNFPPAFKEQLLSRDIEVCAAAFSQMIVEHDLVDFDGESLPPPGDPALYRALPDELIGVLFRAQLAEIGKLPKGNAPS